MFHFFKPPFDNAATKQQHVVTLAAHIHSTKDLLTKVGAALAFPLHFGKNFDAFWDCLRDLPAEPKNIALVHQDLPKLHKDDLETYLELLRDAIHYWEKHKDEHSLEVWFPDNCQKKVNAILKNIPETDDEELE